MSIVFKETNKMFYKIVEEEGEKYLFDMTTISPKTYFWGSLPEKITVDGVKLKKTDGRFEKVVTAKASKSSATVFSLGLGVPLSQFMTALFKAYQVSNHLSLKIALFLLSVFASYLTTLLIIDFIRRSISRRIVNSERQYRLTFKRVTQKRQLEIYKIVALYIVLNLILLTFYFSIKNGTEGGDIVIAFIVSLGFFLLVSGVLPLRERYEKQEIAFEKIEEL